MIYPNWSKMSPEERASWIDDNNDIKEQFLRFLETGEPIRVEPVRKKDIESDLQFFKKMKAGWQKHQA